MREALQAHRCPAPAGSVVSDDARGVEPVGDVGLRDRGQVAGASRRCGPRRRRLGLQLETHRAALGSRRSRPTRLSRPRDAARGGRTRGRHVGPSTGTARPARRSRAAAGRRSRGRGTRSRRPDSRTARSARWPCRRRCRVLPEKSTVCALRYDVRFPDSAAAQYACTLLIVGDRAALDLRVGVGAGLAAWPWVRTPRARRTATAARWPWVPCRSGGCSHEEERGGHDEGRRRRRPRASTRRPRPRRCRG